MKHLRKSLKFYHDIDLKSVNSYSSYANNEAVYKNRQSLNSNTPIRLDKFKNLCMYMDLDKSRQNYIYNSFNYSEKVIYDLIQK